jgi:DNA-directed RNA polymerase alpha subunit
MPVVSLTIHLPDTLWRAVQALAPEEGDANTVILRAVEEYVATAAKNQASRSGKYRDLVKALSTPVADLHLSARPASALQTLTIQYIYEIVQKSPTDRFALPNFRNKSLKEVTEKLATLGLMLSVTLEEDEYGAAVVAAVAANIQAAKR